MTKTACTDGDAETTAPLLWPHARWDAGTGYVRQHVQHHGQSSGAVKQARRQNSVAVSALVVAQHNSIGGT